MIVSVSVYPLNSLLSYNVPSELEKLVKIGTCVKVPLSKRETKGYVVKIEDTENKENCTEDKDSSFKIKDIVSVEYEGMTFFNEDLVKILSWLSTYYSISFSRVLDTALVKYVKEKTTKEISLLTQDFSSIKGSKQLKILEILKDNNGTISYDVLLKEFKNISKIISILEEKNLIKIDIKKEARGKEKLSLDKDSLKNECKKSVTLSSEQENAVKIISNDITKNSFFVYLLHGVTGSGKTEVYIELIKLSLKQGKSAILIVPEISLTPQLLDRFKERLGDNIAVLHSGVKPKERFASWEALSRGECKFVIGARSGVFAPVKNLGVIIVDEEHDSSFKQNDSFRYNARDIAIMRGKLASAPVVLGSATPSLETYYNVIQKKYRKLSLKNRYSQHQKLNFEIINLNKIKKSEMISNNISPALYNAINKALIKNEQVFILYNKRGFASFLQCENCGETLKCPNCSITLTYHKKDNSLKCHQCDYVGKFETKCKSCEEKGEEGVLHLKGAGTEKIFDELEVLFPDAKIARLDRDEVTTLSKYEKILKDVRENKVNILVGTQMIAKGHDIPNVSLVVVVDCDISMFFPDFRATEKTFQLLTQVAGRAGRGNIEGTVILQTRNPDNIAIQKTVNADYQGFASSELKLRKEMNYPPFSFLVRMIISNISNEVAFNDIVLLRKLMEQIILKQSLKISLLGPAPSFIEKISNLYRWNIIIKSQNRKDLNILLTLVNKHAKFNSKTRFVVDIDPQDMF